MREISKEAAEYIRKHNPSAFICMTCKNKKAPRKRRWVEDHVAEKLPNKLKCGV